MAGDSDRQIIDGDGRVSVAPLFKTKVHCPPRLSKQGLPLQSFKGKPTILHLNFQVDFGEELDAAAARKAEEEE